MPNNNKVLVLLLYLMAFIMLGIAAWVLLINSDYLPPCKIKILSENNTFKHISEDELRIVATHSQVGHFFEVNLNQLKGNFETINWVEHADVKRIWPNTIEVTLKEHQAIARWSNLQLLNDQGVLFEAPLTGDLPIFDGVDNSGNEMKEVFSQINPLFAHNDLSIVKLKRDQYSSWEITLNNGILVKLGTESIEKRALRFNQVWKKLLEGGMVVEDVSYLDMRYQDGFVLKPK